MDKKFKPKIWEEKLTHFWEKNKFFQASVNKQKEPFVIILPPPNANGSLHLGHAMYVYEDVMIRYNKLLGKEVLWLPGEDHAGFETWFVFEKELKKKGKSKLDFDQETLYKMVWDFVMEKRGVMREQLKRLGFALDWSKSKFTLDEDIVHIVYLTFKKLYDTGLVYRAERLVNYCIRCRTSFSDLEVLYEEEKGKLWFIKYPLVEEEGFLVAATTRPETMLGDTALAVNPNDQRYQKFIGKKVRVPLTQRVIPVISDEAVDPEFGTGVVKVTPAHSEIDWQIAQRHNLPLRKILDFNGKATKEAGEEYKGLFVRELREKVINDLKSQDLLEKVEEHDHRVGKCYKCRYPIEPLPRKQWFIKIKPLSKSAKKLVQEKIIKLIPKKFEKNLLMWLDKFYDWNISRQIVWGIRIPAYQCQEQKNESCKKNEGWFVSVDKPKRCVYCQSEKLKQDTDTFDTWFSSGQWPFATIMSLAAEGKKLSSLQDYENLSFYKYFYPTTVMETGYDILPWWVARMIMLGYFATKKEPFKYVFLHGLVRDEKGRKMSKSKGNVINPLEMIEKYGADALRAALIFNTQVGSDVNISEDKIKGMRNFANKIWNIGRFLYLLKEKVDNTVQTENNLLSELNKEFSEIKEQYFNYMNNFQFPYALDLLYEFSWHRVADFYIESFKEDLWKGNSKVYENLNKVFSELLKMLHPFIPFVTEGVYQQLNGKSLLQEGF